ncbi:MAG: IS3 family transposase [Halofilum sp. (in: g-proteobacteria)]|nr:IS3 family transposase [Halofilum sp. (in: g-proteobacteria)]
MQKRKTFSREFKLEAVRLLDQGDKTAADIARELGIKRNQLYKWKEQLTERRRGGVPRPRPSGQRQGGRDRPAQARTRARERRARHPKKSRHVLCQGVRVRYRFIHEHRDRFRVRSMCRVLAVSRSGFYDWCGRPHSQRQRANQRLLERIRAVHDRSRSNAGAVKTWRALLAQGEACGRHRVARLRRAHGIEARRMRRFRSAYTARNAEPAASNRLDQHFVAERPDQAWVGDITFVPTRRGWLYLAVVVDLYARRVVGWAMSERINQSLVRDALAMAIRHRRPAPGLIHHTDQGAQYRSAAYQRLLQAHEMIPSMSRKGNCYDNACAESFFSTLKNELTWHCDFADRTEARTALFEFIELYYNRSRDHQYLDYRSPAGFEELGNVA